MISVSYKGHMRRKIILECRYIDLFALVKPTFSLYFGSWDTPPQRGAHI